jgi:hypothetical protein
MTVRVLLALALFATNAQSADDKGRYWHGGGVGSTECPKFIETMSRAKRHGLGTLGYANETQGYVMFLAGFQTAYNSQTPKTCDVFAGINADQRLAWIENYCQQNPLEKFSAAAVALAVEVHPRRLQSCK